MLKRIILLAFPVLLSNLLQSSITVIDTIMVGRLGPKEIAAVGLANTLRLLLLIFALSVAGGAISLIAQAKGSRDKKRMSLITKQSIISGFMLSVIVAAIGLLIAFPTLGFMDSSGDLLTVLTATDFLTIILYGTPFLILNIVMNRLMQGAGDTVTPLILTSLLAIFNIGLNYVLIFGWYIIPAYGVNGAAYGTVLSRFLIVLITLYLFYSGKNVVKILRGRWKVHWPMIKDILNIGVPSGIQGFFRHAGNVFIMKIITATSSGTLGAAAMAIGFQVESLVIQPTLGVNVAATSIIGQKLGRWQISSAFRYGNIMILLGIVIATLFAVPMYVFAKPIILFFDPSANETILETGISYFQVNALIMPLYVLGIIITGSLRGAGDTRPAMYSSVLNRNLITIFLAWYLAFPLGMDFRGVWYGVALGKILDALYMSVVWYRKKWIFVALKQTEIYRKHLIHMQKDHLSKFLTEIRSKQMAIPATLEKVNNQGVDYSSPSSTVSVIFENGHYRIVP